MATDSAAVLSCSRRIEQPLVLLYCRSSTLPSVQKTHFPYDTSKAISHIFIYASPSLQLQCQWHKTKTITFNMRVEDIHISYQTHFIEEKWKHRAEGVTESP